MCPLSKNIDHSSVFSSKTIARDFLFWLVALIVLIVAVAEGGYYLYSNKMTQLTVNERADTLIDELSSMLMVPLYNRDMESINHVCLTYSQIPDLYGLQLYDEQGILLFNSIADRSGKVFRERRIFRGELYLGHVTLILSDSFYRQNRQQTLMAILFMGLSLIAAMVVGIHTIMYYILIKPLQQFNQGLLEIADGNYNTRLEAVRHTDLNSSVDAVNTMAEKIERVVDQLSVTRDFLQDVLNSMPSIMIGVDNRCCITNLNHAAVSRSGRSYLQCIGRELQEVFPGLERLVSGDIQKSIHQQKVISIEQKDCVVLGHKKCAEITVYPLHGAAPDGAVIRIDDITDRTRLQEVMVQTEKMLSVGGLGAGMAHEINNPLGGILQAAQNIERRLSSQLEKNHDTARQCGFEMEQLETYLKMRDIDSMLAGIRDAGQRAAKIVQNMLQFSRRSESSMEFCLLSEMLDRVLELANNDYDLKRKYDFRNIRIVRHYSRSLRVFCAKTQIEQVFLNLFKNAAHAYGQYDSSAGIIPEISIKTYRKDGFVFVEVVDKGEGMSDDVKKRIFEPFFTTKTVGEGTGLGLAVSFFIIVEQHNGELLVESEPGQGTTFTVKLPEREQAEFSEGRTRSRE